tara:strand:- start:2579 stop:2734 length:156 start_codon:yes stop_codon:yes gene_type:complete
MDSDDEYGAEFPQSDENSDVNSDVSGKAHADDLEDPGSPIRVRWLRNILKY